MTEDELVSDDAAVPQAIGIWARAHGYHGILAPSAVLAESHTLVVFKEYMAGVAVAAESVVTPPPPIPPSRVRERPA